MDYLKEIISISEKKASLIGFLLTIIVGYTLYAHNKELNIEFLVNLIYGFLATFATIGSLSIVKDFFEFYTEYKNKLNEFKGV